MLDAIKINSLPNRRLFLNPYERYYILTNVKTTKRSANTAATFMNMSLLRAGMNSAKPYHRKNRTNAIVAQDQAIIHSPLVKKKLTTQSAVYYDKHYLLKEDARRVVQFKCYFC